MKALSYLKTLIFEFGKGFAIFLLGAITFIGHRTLPNVTADVVILYQGIGITLVVIGLMDAATAIWRVEKDEKERQQQAEERQWHLKVQQSLDALRTDLSEVKQLVALSKQEVDVVALQENLEETSLQATSDNQHH